MTTQEKQEPQPEPASAFREIVSVAIVVGLLGTLTYAFVREQASMAHVETALIVDVKVTTTELTDVCGPPTKDGRPTVISMLYSDDKHAWIEDAAQKFSNLCPNIQVKLTAMSDINSADAILTGEQNPTLWAPADDLVVRYLDARRKKEKPNEKPFFEPSEATSIAASPLVVLMWEDRMQVVQRILANRTMDHGSWVETVCPLVPIHPAIDGVAIRDMVPGTWIDWYNPIMPPPPDPKARPAKPPKPTKDIDLLAENQPPEYHAPFPSLGKIRSWGRVKVVHPSPTRSAAGLEATYLMAYDYLLPMNKRSNETKSTQNASMTDPLYRSKVLAMDADKQDFARAFSTGKKEFAKWLRRCEAGLEPVPESTELLTDAFFSVGKTRYDAIVTYEHFTFKLLDQLADNDKTMASMEVIYPRPTLMNQHPVVTINPADLTAEQVVSADKWIAYLRSVDIQKKAIEYGFRPVNPDVSIRNYDSEANPFLRYRRYGIEFSATILEPPRLDGNIVYEIVRTWEDATGRN